jgi:hypothetical protein
LVYADDVNLLGDNIDTVKKKKTETLTDASKGVVFEVNTKRTKYLSIRKGSDSGV